MTWLTKPSPMRTPLRWSRRDFNIAGRLVVRDEGRPGEAHRSDDLTGEPQRLGGCVADVVHQLLLKFGVVVAQLRESQMKGGRACYTIRGVPLLNFGRNGHNELRTAEILHWADRLFRR